VATCRHCSTPIERQPGEFWKHRSNRQERCMPGTRNAQMADAAPGSARRA
jgi:hypothetical protein